MGKDESNQDNIVSIYFVVNDIKGGNDVNNIINQIMYKSSMNL